MTTQSTAVISPFTVRFDQAAVTDLRTRLARTRWPAEPAGVGTDQGMPVATVREMAEAWAALDLSAVEARLNAFPQFVTEVDGERVHFWHVRSTVPGATPLLLLHGWPSSVLEFEAVVGPLTDPAAHGAPAGTPAFDVVVPSLPGFGFSGPTTSTGWDSARSAGALARLMEHLGYEHWGVAGGDVGALVAREVGALDPAGLVGVHVLQWFAFPSGDDEEKARITPQDWASLQSGSTADFQSKAGYRDIQSKRPGTLAFALDDSPAGVLAWNAELWTGWGDVPPVGGLETFLAHVSVYWFTGTSGSAARHYLGDARSGAGYRDLPVRVPVAVAVFPWDFRSIRACVERSANLVRYTELEQGGHFAYVTDAEAVVGDLREFFGSL